MDRRVTKIAILIAVVFTSACAQEPLDSGAYASLSGGDAGTADSGQADAGDDPRCDNPEFEPVAPPVNGFCAVELILDSTTVVDGQGISEGTLEASVKVTAGGVSFTSPASGFRDYDVKETHPHGRIINTFDVPAGGNRPVQVCVEFTEDDNGGLNGDDDVGSRCRTVTLTCPQPQTQLSIGADLCHLDSQGNCTTTNGRMRADFTILRADADDDGVINPEDWTPDVCDEERKGQEGRGSIVWFHYGDGAINSFAQSIGTNLSKAMVGYDFVILLIDPSSVGPFNLDPAALNQADMVLDPTEQNLFVAMREMTRQHLDMDIWLHSHGHRNGTFGDFEALSDDDDQPDDDSPEVTGQEIIDGCDPAVIGTDLVPIRMVYSVTCNHDDMNAAWMTVGAYVTSGADEVNFYPNFYGRFADAWNGGQRYGASVAFSETPLSRTVAHTFIAGEGALPPWWCIPGVNGVLGNNGCAEDFFMDTDEDGPDEAQYPIQVIYDATLTGKQNMNLSSARFFEGDVNIGKFVPATLTW